MSDASPCLSSISVERQQEIAAEFRSLKNCGYLERDAANIVALRYTLSADQVHVIAERWPA